MIMVKQGQIQLFFEKRNYFQELFNRRTPYAINSIFEFSPPTKLGEKRVLKIT